MKPYKITIALMTVLSLASFNSFESTESYPYGNAPRQTGIRMVDALRQASAQAYLQEFPTLAELMGAMDQSRNIYGAHLEAAKQELAEQYVTDIVPAAQENFERLLGQGEARGIVWNEVEFVRWEINQRTQIRWDEIPFVLVVQCHEREHRIAVKGMVLKGQLRLSQHLALI